MKFIKDFDSLYKSEIFNAECWQLEIPYKSIGIYYLYNENQELVYIGKSKSTIRSRVNNHISQQPSMYMSKKDIAKLQHKRNIVRFVSFEEVDIDYIDSYEIELIKKYKPLLNVKHK